MGEVYRARDSRLGRDVAIKILPSSVTFDPERRARFEREARTLASLSHPNIGAIYGLEDMPGPESNSARALVLELVDGRTLEELCALPDRLPIPEVIALARQLVDALQAAHEKGITHRDLKPANVKITSEGIVKVLDFGLAKAGCEDGTDSSGTAVTLVTQTQEGVILGTPAYMSPEQARGRSVDRRADIWAFGCVLFELLSGTMPFRRETLTGTLAAILEEDPDWSKLSAAPIALRRLVRRCLIKDPRRRLRDIADARFELDEAESGGDQPIAVLSRPRPVTFQRLTALPGLHESPAISPDGKMVAFVAAAGGFRQIWMLLLAGGPPLQITRVERDHQHPRWSPDSSALIYFTAPTHPGDEGTIWEIPALGGYPRPVVAAQGPGDVSHDGLRIAYFRTTATTTELVTVDRNGDDARPVTAVPDCDGSGWPSWSPDDRNIAFQSSMLTHFDERILVASVGDGSYREVARATLIRGFAWLPDGSGILYASATAASLPYPPTCNLRAVNKDGSGDRQVTYGDMSYVEPDVHRSGLIVASRLRIQSDLWKIPVGGTPDENTRHAVRITRQTGQVQTPSSSPDGREVAYLADHGGHANLWVIGANGGVARQITFERDPAVAIGVPAWSPDGRHILYLVSREHTELWLTTPHGRGHRRLVDPGFGAEWSADGKYVYFMSSSRLPRGIDKINVQTGEVVRVQSGGVHAPAPGRDALYFAERVPRQPGTWDWAIQRATPDDAPATTICEVSSERIPHSSMFVHTRPSPDGTRLALPMLDGPTTNVWMIPVDGTPMYAATDFSAEPVLIVRRIDWSPDSKFVVAALAQRNADIIVLDGLL